MEVTVLISVYKESLEKVKLAIDSIVNQTYTDFLFLIIVDNPDNLEVIHYLQYLTKCDDRFEMIVNTQNLGLAQSLNRGIDRVVTPYLARMDADDIAESDRLEKQIGYLKDNPTVDLLGTNVIYIDEKSNVIGERGTLPCSSEAISEFMRYTNVLNHPTFMGKTSVFKEVKYRNLLYSQDYDFVCRLLEKNYVVNNLSACLLKYRITSFVSNEKKQKQRVAFEQIRHYYRLGKLSTIDIEKTLEASLKNYRADYYKLVDTYNNFVSLLKKKNYLKAISFLIKNLFVKGFVGELFNSLKIFLLKRKYQ
uniref:Glycosyltransferase n=1 Tax=Streptococcus suis TaxID=1307 RepID=A0A2H4H6F1_STRSU|nr:glycosyltransferase [Streptococcus suis]